MTKSVHFFKKHTDLNRLNLWTGTEWHATEAQMWNGENEERPREEYRETETQIIRAEAQHRERGEAALGSGGECDQRSNHYVFDD